jgi:MFS family permease
MQLISHECILFLLVTSVANSLIDVFFAHERGTRLASFALALGAGSFMGPVAAGYITESQGWRFCFWYLVIFFGILLVVQIFSLEESIYRRVLQHPERLGELKIETGSKQDIVDKKPLTRDGECPTPQTLDDGILPIACDAGATRSNSELVQPRPKMTYRQRMAPIHTRNADPKPWWYLFLFPFRLVLFPAVVWTGVLGGIQIMWLSLLSVTQSELFGAAPYNFGIAAVGDTNIAAFVGGFFGMLWGGPLSDWYVVRRARHNKGIMEPEFRLWLLIVPALVNTAGLLMYGIGAYRGLPWIISAGIGTAFIGFGIGAGGAIGLTYAIDCYPGIAAESMVLILFIRNVLGLLFTLAIQYVSFQIIALNSLTFHLIGPGSMQWAARIRLLLWR